MQNLKEDEMVHARKADMYKRTVRDSEKEADKIKDQIEKLIN